MLSEVDVDVVSEVDVDVFEVDVLAEVDDDAVSKVDVDDDAVSEVVGVDMATVLDIESVPADDALIDSLAVAAVVPSSPLQAKRVRPTSAAITSGADPWTEQSTAEQKGQRLSLSQT